MYDPPKKITHLQLGSSCFSSHKGTKLNPLQVVNLCFQEKEDMGKLSVRVLSLSQDPEGQKVQLIYVPIVHTVGSFGIFAAILFRADLKRQCLDCD